MALNSRKRLLSPRAIKHPIQKTKSIKAEGMTFVRDPLDSNDNKENPSETKNMMKRINIIDNILKDLENKLTHSEETLFDDFADMFMTAKDDISKLKEQHLALSMEVKNQQDILKSIEVLQARKLKEATNSFSDPNVAKKLSVHQRKQLELEMKELEKIGKFGLKDCQSSELEEILNDLFFQRTTNTIIDKCPLLTEMIQIVAVGKNTNNNSGKKNTSYKLKCAIQLLFAQIYSSKQDDVE